MLSACTSAVLNGFVPPRRRVGMAPLVGYSSSSASDGDDEAETPGLAAARAIGQAAENVDEWTADGESSESVEVQGEAELNGADVPASLREVEEGLRPCHSVCVDASTNKRRRIVMGDELQGCTSSAGKVDHGEGMQPWPKSDLQSQSPKQRHILDNSPPTLPPPEKGNSCLEGSWTALPPPPFSDDDGEHNNSGVVSSGHGSVGCSAAVVSTSRTPERPMRQFPHVDGQFATHIFLPVQLPIALSKAVEQHVAWLRSATSAAACDHPVHAIEPSSFHLSVSRTLTLTFAQIDPFVESLSRALRRCEKLCLRSKHFARLANDTRTRFFAAVEFSAESRESVDRLVDAVDQVVIRYGASRFYSERRLHVSFAWSLSSLPPLEKYQPPEKYPLDSFMLKETLICDRVVCRIGERETLIALKQSRS